MPDISLPLGAFLPYISEELPARELVFGELEEFSLRGGVGVRRSGGE